MYIKLKIPNLKVKITGGRGEVDVKEKRRNSVELIRTYPTLK